MVSPESWIKLESAEKPAQQINGSRERDFICILYRLATSQPVAPQNYRLLSFFINLTLNQASGGYDELADRLAAQEEKPSHRKLSRTYWPAKETRLYNRFFDEVEAIYPEGPARQAIMGAVKNWYKTFHGWENAIRGVEPSPGTKTTLAGAEPGIRNYREITNRAYSLTLLQIINPLGKEENQRLNKEVFHPILMMYQVTTDFGQLDLPCQKTKMTMDKLTGKDYTKLSSLEKLKQTSKDCQQMVREYAGDLGGSWEKPPIKQAVEMANLANYFYNFLRFSVLKDKKGRFIISLPENLSQYVPATSR